MMLNYIFVTIVFFFVTCQFAEASDVLMNERTRPRQRILIDYYDHKGRFDLITFFEPDESYTTQYIFLINPDIKMTDKKLVTHKGNLDYSIFNLSDFVQEKQVFVGDYKGLSRFLHNYGRTSLRWDTRVLGPYDRSTEENWLKKLSR